MFPLRYFLADPELSVLLHPGQDSHPEDPERGRSLSPVAADLSIPKNRSTGNLHANAPKGPEKARIRFSDAGLTPAEYDTMSRLVLSEGFRFLLRLQEGV